MPTKLIHTPSSTQIFPWPLHPQLDVVVPLEAPREASRLLLQFGAGWPKTLEDVSTCGCC